MTGQNDRAEWLTLRQALDAYRLSERTMRRRLTSGEIEGYKATGPKGEEWRVRPPGVAPEPPQGVSDNPGAHERVTGQHEDMAPPLALIENAYRRLLDQNQGLIGELGRVQEARIEDARSAADRIARLEERLEAAQAEVERLRAADAPSDIRPRFRWFWQR